MPELIAVMNKYGDRFLFDMTNKIKYVKSINDDWIRVDDFNPVYDVSRMDGREEDWYEGVSKQGR